MTVQREIAKDRDKSPGDVFPGKSETDKPNERTRGKCDSRLNTTLHTTLYPLWTTRFPFAPRNRLHTEYSKSFQRIRKSALFDTRRCFILK
ncbi:hypothetical protein KQX54_008437 [Cotesia glomerata]|uniref:Uncharacterized protein n=1 Tax=Cotesia glomerata TaxID=32391 RepID=A0AAV7I675_COTGL|nr:hypothetical protein KQX54_008437 [Cotesia glomerata]